jgi:Fe/S biogenesis protein NfuA
MYYDISPQAITFLNSLFQEYDLQFSAVIHITNPGTPSAILALELENTQSLLNNPNMSKIPAGIGYIFYKESDRDVIHNLKIGYKATLTGGELEIDLPLLYGDQKQYPLVERIRHYFSKEIQPALDAHKGKAIVKELTSEHDLIIEFSGGCQGCSMASVTLKNLIDQKIREHFPQVRHILDKTNHVEGANPYA